MTEQPNDPNILTSVITSVKKKREERKKLKFPFKKPNYLIGMILVVLLISVGVVGLVVPFIQGVLLIVLGLLLLLEYHKIPWLEAKRDLLHDKYEAMKENVKKKVQEKKDKKK